MKTMATIFFVAIIATMIAAANIYVGKAFARDDSSSSQSCAPGEHASPTGVCCPAGTTAVHSMCLNRDQWQQKEQSDANIEHCVLGVTKGAILGGPAGIVTGGASSCIG